MLVSEKVTNSGGLMLMCRWAGVNALAQNKFRSTDPLFTCLKSPIETPAECVKSVES